MGGKWFVYFSFPWGVGVGVGEMGEEIKLGLFFGKKERKRMIRKLASFYHMVSVSQILQRTNNGKQCKLFEAFKYYILNIQVETEVLREMWGDLWN